MKHIRLDILRVNQDEYERLANASTEYQIGSVDEKMRWINLFISGLEITVFPHPDDKKLIMIEGKYAKGTTDM